MNSHERFLAACRREPVDRPPVWLMRQAGRYLPEYRMIRARHDFFAMCKTPEIACEVSLQPWQRFGVDAVIVFSDILFIPEAMGLTLTFVEKEGIRLAGAVDKLRPPKTEKLQFVGETIKLLKARLKNEVPVIGFSGGPFTLAVYALAGDQGASLLKGVREWIKTKPKRLHKLLGAFADAVAGHCKLQTEAGADVIQIFDTWAGELTKEEFREWALPYLKTVVSTLRPSTTLGAGIANCARPPRLSEAQARDGGRELRISDSVDSIRNPQSAIRNPFIVYSRKCRHILEDLVETGADVVSIDPDTPMKEAIQRIGNKVAIQGNLDPRIFLTTPGAVRRETQRLLGIIKGRPGHILNLGHGVLPTTPIECVEEFVKTVKGFLKPV